MNSTIVFRDRTRTLLQSRGRLRDHGTLTPLPFAERLSSVGGSSFLTQQNRARHGAVSGDELNRDLEGLSFCCQALL
jgi:hypothetical protein